MPPLPKSRDEITLDGDWVNTLSYIYAYLDHHIIATWVQVFRHFGIRHFGIRHSGNNPVALPV